MFETNFLCPTAIAAYREAPLVDDRYRSGIDAIQD